MKTLISYPESKFDLTQNTHPPSGGWSMWRLMAVSPKDTILFTLYGTGTGTGTREWWVSVLCYVLYTLHRNRDRDRETLFSIVPIPLLVPVPVLVSCSVYEPLQCISSLLWYKLTRRCSHLRLYTYIIYLLHHWLMLYRSTLSLYIVNLQWNRTSDKFLTIFIFGIHL